MNINDLRPADDFAKQYGVKSLCYGPPGAGKTPLIKTAPRPVLLALEPGLLSMKGSNVPTWIAPTMKEVDEFFKWFFGSNESSNFDTLCIDSVSELAERIATEELNKKSNSGNKVDGKAAYGAMSRKVYENYLQPLYMYPNKHIYLTAKRGIRDVAGMEKSVPYFPGRDLYTKIPHLYDNLIYLDEVMMQGQNGLPTKVMAMRCRATPIIEARARSPQIAELEACDLGQFFQKCMA